MPDLTPSGMSFVGPLPAEAIQAAVKAAEDAGSLGETMRIIRSLKSDVQGKYLDGVNSQMETAVRAALGVLGATVERDWINDQGEAIYPGPSPDPTHSRIVTSWRRSPDE